MERAREAWIVAATGWIELAIVALLLVVAALTILLIAVQIVVTVVREPEMLLSSQQVLVILGDVLTGFVAIELLKIGVAYMRHENVVPTVLEAALVAVARKVVIFEPAAQALVTGLVLAALLPAVGLTSWLLAKARQQPAIADEL